jgi:esterase/lipase
MNRNAYMTTALAIKALSGLSGTKVRLHGVDQVPSGGVIFVTNQFTRLDMLLVPYHLFQLTGKPVWSLAEGEEFNGAWGAFLNRHGGQSHQAPDRDRVMVKTLLTGEASWIVFPPRNNQTDRPPAPAATLALRTEFYRQRIREMNRVIPGEARRLAQRYGLLSPEAVAAASTFVVPVNLTYYPLRGRDTVLGELAKGLVEGRGESHLEEILVQGSRLLAGVDLDLRFGAPIPVAGYLQSRVVRADITARRAIDFDDPIASRGMLRKTAHRIMARCQGVICRLTTVNHDHLFAAMLRRHPANAMEASDLRRRVFLAASTLPFEKMAVHRHPALLENQVDLLTDDHRGRTADFLALALARGSVRQETDGWLVKTAEAPLDEICRDIKRLGGLTAGLSEIAEQPELRVRYRVGRWLRERAEAAYERDWHRFDQVPDRTPKNVGRPWFARSAARRPGVLLIHGYMAAPLEVAQLAARLAADGYWVYAPRLKGHGTAPEDLADCSRHDWIASVDEGYAMLANCCPRVVVGGFSTGAGLALDLAARGLAVAGVFAVCPPFVLHDGASRLVPAVDAWNKLLDRVRVSTGKMEFVENRPENPHINYKRNPVRGVRELSRLMDGLEDRLARITAPALVVQSLGDPVVDYRGTWRLFDRLETADREFFLFHFNRHGILLGEGADRVHRVVAEFVARVA